MVSNAPDHEFRAAGEPHAPPLDENTLDTFKQLMEESVQAQKAKNKAAKAKKQQERLLKQKTLSDQFKRAQRYLGLRPNAEVNPLTPGSKPPAIDPVCMMSTDVSILLIIRSGTTCALRVRPVRGLRMR